MVKSREAYKMAVDSSDDKLTGKTYTFGYVSEQLCTVQFRSIRHPLVTVTRLTKLSFRHLALEAMTGSEFRQVRLGISIF